MVTISRTLNRSPVSSLLPTVHFLISALIPKIEEKKKEERKRDSTKRRLDTTGPYSRNLYERRERYESSSPGVCNCAIRQRERELGFRSCCYSQSRNRIWPPVRFARTIREFCVGRDYENVDVDTGRGRHFRDCA